MAPVAVSVAFAAALAVEWTPAAQLLVPYATLLSGNGTLGGDDEVFLAVVAQFPAYGLIVGAAELTRERAGRRALLAIGLIHVIARSEERRVGKECRSRG